MDNKEIEELLWQLADSFQDFQIASKHDDYSQKIVAGQRMMQALLSLKASLLASIHTRFQLRGYDGGDLKWSDTREGHFDCNKTLGHEVLIDMSFDIDCSTANQKDWRWHKGPVMISFLNSNVAETNNQIPEAKGFGIESLISQRDSDELIKIIFGNTPPNVKDMP